MLTEAAEVFDWDERALRASQARLIVLIASCRRSAQPMSWRHSETGGREKVREGQTTDAAVPK